MGFSTVMRSVYETYANGNSAVRDCIEYSMRGFYRIHQDAFVYQTCVVIADGDFETGAVYDLLSSLSRSNTASCGVASGVRDLNKKEEIDALVQMLSGPELSLGEIGIAAAERQAAKLASVNLEEIVFPRENIVKLFITIIAANPGTTRAAKFFRLFAGLVPHIKDASSQELLREGVDALGGVITKAKAGDENAMLAFHPGEDDTKVDWYSAKREYILLVESFARSGGRLNAASTTRVLDMVMQLLKRQPDLIGPAASSILRELAKTHLAASRPGAFLKDIAPLFRTFFAAVDFSGVIENITLLIRRTGSDLDHATQDIIINNYVEPCIRALAVNDMANTTFRANVVELLIAAVTLQGDAFGVLERFPPDPSLLASAILPFCLLLELSDGMSNDTYDGLWVRLLHYVMSSPPSRSAGPARSQVSAASAVLSLQIVKVIAVRASDSISAVKGLWMYISQQIQSAFEQADGHFYENRSDHLGGPSPRVVDWMMWSFFELLALHRSPLHILCHLRMQTALISVASDAVRSRPSTHGERLRTASSPQMMGGRARTASALTPPFKTHSRQASGQLPTPLHPSHSRMPSYGSRLSPNPSGGHSRFPSQNLSSHLGGHARTVSGSGSINATLRPSFAALSARRASRPVFDGFPAATGMHYRFPSSQPVRQLTGGEKGGGAIVHLLGAPNQVPGPGFSPHSTLASVDQASQAIKTITITSDELQKRTRRAVQTCLVVFGYEWECSEDEEPVRMWSVHDALQEISEQTRLFIEHGFGDVFHRADPRPVSPGSMLDDTEEKDRWEKESVEK